MNKNDLPITAVMLVYLCVMVTIAVFGDGAVGSLLIATAVTAITMLSVLFIAP